MCNVIAIGGLKNSGKDTSAKMVRYLLNAPKFLRYYPFYKLFGNFPGKWRIDYFARPLKEVLSIITGRSVNDFNNRVFKENWCVYLDTMHCLPIEYLDSEKGSLMGDSQFNKYLKSELPIPANTYLTIRQLMQYAGTDVMRRFFGDKLWINSVLNNAKKDTIISDLRFKTEFEELKKRDAKTIYIENSSVHPGTHPSEREIVEIRKAGEFNYIVANEGTLADLFYNLKGCLYE